MKISSERSIHEMSGAKLRRARHLYALLIREAVESDLSGKQLQIAAEKGIKRGLWKDPSERNVRYSLLRRFCKKHPQYDDTFGWHRYMKDFGWSIKNMGRILELKAA